MDASYKIQRGIHVHLIQFFMCPEFWVHINEHGSLLRYWNIFRSGMGVRRTNGKPRLILTSFVLALSSISPFTPKYEL